MLVFMATQDMVDYHAELLGRFLSSTHREGQGFPKVDVLRLHGSMSQADRVAVFKRFRDHKEEEVRSGL